MRNLASGPWGEHRAYAPAGSGNAEGGKTKAKDDAWNESLQSRKTIRRISKAGFALLSLF